MTNSGRRVLIRITFDVMSVRKPLLSTSALKRKGVTIVCNRDYDRIILRNETANLVSDAYMSDSLMGAHLAKHW